jgi:hypothetical protein
MFACQLRACVTRRKKAVTAEKPTTIRLDRPF